MQEAEKKSFILNAAYVATWLVVIYLCFKYLLSYLAPFIIGFGIAYLIRPLADWLNKKVKMRPKAAAVFAAFIFYIALSIVISILVGLMGSQVKQLLSNLPNILINDFIPIVKDFSEFIVSTISKLSVQLGSDLSNSLNSLISTLIDVTKTVSATLLGLVTTQVTKLPIYLIGLLFTVISSIYFCIDYRRIVDFFFVQFSSAKRKNIMKIKDFMVGIVGKFLKAYLIIFIMTFLELVVGLVLLKVDYFLPIAFIIAALDILPLIGSGAFLLPWAIGSFVTGAHPLGVGLLVLWGIITVIRNIMEPRIVSNQIGLHPIISLISIFLAIRLLGFSGIFLGPIIAMLIIFLNENGFIAVYKNN